MDKLTMSYHTHGYLAEMYSQCKLEVQVCQSAAGYYIGTMNPDGSPCSRESGNYYHTAIEADKALREKSWIQRMYP